ncbi:MAG TPA: DUF2381 family protein [Archangium sp.]|jgi:hypothetical protein|uniref:DUF2381 family protein n=1 Tax=Archangium sp. TaxID=1872627 RepID=UPI002ED8D8BD
MKRPVLLLPGLLLTLVPRGSSAHADESVGPRTLVSAVDATLAEDTACHEANAALRGENAQLSAENRRCRRQQGTPEAALLRLLLTPKVEAALFDNPHPLRGRVGPLEAEARVFRAAGYMGLVVSVSHSTVNGEKPWELEKPMLVRAAGGPGAGGVEVKLLLLHVESGPLAPGQTGRFVLIYQASIKDDAGPLRLDLFEKGGARLIRLND